MSPARGCSAVLLVSCALAGLAAPAFAQDPALTATVYVGGFNSSGAFEHGVFGVDRDEALIDSVAALAGAAVARGGSSLPPNVVASAFYYGDTPPPYYTPADIAQLDSVTALSGGGVPRYALIMAKFARDVLQRSGARQVNFVSASFGSLVVRWLIEKDVEGLASQGRIARWLTIEGVLAGNWAASHDELLTLLTLFTPLPIDVLHMRYDWVSAFLHTPRTEADHPVYGHILVGQMACTDDGAYDGALSLAMLANKEWQPNDGVQAMADAHFATVTARSRLDDLPPTLGFFHNDHYGIQGNRAARAQAAVFMTQRRRVTVTMTSAQVTDLHEPHSVFFDLRPAEVVLETRVYSPAIAARWGIVDPVCTIEREGAIAPLRLYNANGETQEVDQVVFDDLVLDEETELRLFLHARELDYDWRYGIFESLPDACCDDMGGGELSVSTLAPGTYTFRTPAWNCTVAVAVHEYPFAPAAPLSVAAPASTRPSLRIGPNPHGASVRIAVEGLPPSSPGSTTATLEVFDLSGRLVHRIQGDARAGIAWDGRDAAGALLPAGLYLHRVVSPLGTWSGKSLLVR